MWTLALLVLPPAAAQTAEITVALKPEYEVAYEGAPLPVQITVRNSGSEALRNPIRTPLWKSLEVRGAEGQTLKAKGKPATRAAARPKELLPAASYGGTVDLARLYPELKHAGRYEIQWSADGIASKTHEFIVILRYDPAKRYTARIDPQY